MAVVLGVPMEECPACAERYMAWDVAEGLDALLDAMLAGDIEIAVRHFQVTTAAGKARSSPTDRIGDALNGPTEAR